MRGGVGCGQAAAAATASVVSALTALRLSQQLLVSAGEGCAGVPERTAWPGWAAQMLVLVVSMDLLMDGEYPPLTDSTQRQRCHSID